MAAPAKRLPVTLPDSWSDGKARSHVLDLESAETAGSDRQAAVPQAAAAAFASPSPFSASAATTVKKPAAERPVVYEARLAPIPGLGSLQAIANRSFRPRPQPVAPATPLLGSINLTPAGAGPGEQFQTEITAAVTLGDRVFLLSSGGGSTLQVTDATTPAALRLVGREPLGNYTVQSVAAYGNLVAVALSPAGYNLATDLASMRGLVRFYRLDSEGNLDQLVDVPVGYLPDSLAFTADGDQLVVANEGQPNWGPAGPPANGQPTYPQAYTVDPVGSIGIIDIQGTVNLRFTYTDLALGSLALPAGIRLAGPKGTSQGQFLEPEYVTIEGTTAYVTLQESNGVAKVDLRKREITDVFALGAVDFSTQAVDLTDRPANVFNPLLGQPFQALRMPDGIDAFRTRGKEYFITANEGDAQVYADNDNAVYLDEIRNGITSPSTTTRLKTIANPPVITAGAVPSLGGPSSGTPTNQAFGSRSVSIFDADSGALVWDSGNSLQTIAVAARTYDDGRSDDKGVEPETVVVAEVNGRQLAVVGLERGLQTTLVLFDVTDPAAATYCSHTVIDGSVSPEGLTVIPAAKSSTGRAVLAVSNEISNTLNLLDLETLATTAGIGSAGFFAPTMLRDAEGGASLEIDSLLTNGEFTAALKPGGSVYAPTGIFDGMGAYDNGDGTYTLLVNSELANSAGYGYLVNQEAVPGGVILNGARVHRFIVDADSDDDPTNGQQSRILRGGIAYASVYGADGALITKAAEVNALVPSGKGFSRFCSSTYVAAESFGPDRGFVDGIYLTGEESSEGLIWALDAAQGDLWAVPAVGRAGWENAALVDTGSTDTVAVMLMDDSTAPIYLWVGTKSEAAGATFLERNGLADASGALYTWVPDSEAQGGIGSGAGVVGVPDSADLLAVPIGTAASGSWQRLGSGAEIADLTERQLRDLAFSKGALQLSRLEDLSVNPEDGRQVVFATTGNSDFGAADRFGNLITMDLSGAFNGAGLVATGNSSSLSVIYDGDRLFDASRISGSIDTDAERAYAGSFGATIIRSPDNLVWSGDGSIYVQEDRSVDAAYFSAVEAEASIWKVNPLLATDPLTGLAVTPQQAATERWSVIDRSSVPTGYGQSDASPTDAGNWESSGIIDVSTIYGAAPGTWFLADVQAHSLRNGNLWGSTYLAEGGQIDLIRQSQQAAAVL